MNIKEITEANRIAWNETMPKHQVVSKSKWDSLFSQNNYIVQEGIELLKLQEIGIEGKRIAHFCCNNGVQLLSLKNLGASVCVGFDISDEAVKEGNERAENCKIDCRFIQTDIYDIPETFNGSFDLVYITIGALCWLPDLKLFFKKVNDVLAPGGNIFIYEQHPFIGMLPDIISNTNDLKIVNPYFTKEPIKSNDGIDYIGNTTYKSSDLFSFNHTISDIIMGLIENKMNLKFFKEYSKNISEVCEDLERIDLKLPLSYLLIGEKM